MTTAASETALARLRGAYPLLGDGASLGLGIGTNALGLGAGLGVVAEVLGPIEVFAHGCQVPSSWPVSGSKQASRV